MRFVVKYGDDSAPTELDWEEVLVTRQGLAEFALENFKESPVIGNGFQVSKMMEGQEISSFGQLLSAPIEKGVWVTAILEEGGVVGFMLFMLFLIIAFWGMLSRQAFTGACALFVLMISNFGEFSFFSTSSTGGIAWALIFVGGALDALRVRRRWQLRCQAMTLPFGGMVRDGNHVER